MELRLISDAHDCLSTGGEVPCDGCDCCAAFDFGVDSGRGDNDTPQAIFWNPTFILKCDAASDASRAQRPMF